MKKLNPEFCALIREARRAAKLSQSVVAEEVGCHQPALSAFEQGDCTKIGDDAVERLSKKFGVNIESANPVSGDSGKCPPRIGSFAPGSGFCPNPRCPTNRTYQVDGRDHFKPDRTMADPVGGRFCAMCGEVLERLCPGCGAPVHAGAFCSFCGDPYVSG